MQQQQQQPQQHTTFNRRPHQKSRYGCRQCKQRKVKCDEKKPKCGHCNRYAVECVYLIEPPSRQKTAQDTEQRPLRPAANGTETSTPVDTHPRTRGIPPGQPLFSLLDMELLHYYTCFTALTLSHKPERRKARQEIIPQLAFEHDFLMHGLLSLAAMHLIHDQPHRREALLPEATRLQDLGLTGFRRQMQTINKYNCHALFAFSSVLVICTWASSQTLEDFFFKSSSNTSILDDDSFLDCTALVRGVKDLLESTWDWISKGPMATFLKFAQDGMTLPTLPPEVEARLGALKALWASEKCALTESEKAGLKDSHEILRDAYVYMSVPNNAICKVSTTHFWLTRIPTSYTNMLGEKKPEALILLAHYCILLGGIREYWWMEDKGVHLLKSIHQTLGPEWRAWIQWPMELLGAK